MCDDSSATTCTYPNCDSEKIVVHLGVRQESYCADHLKYGMGRTFGPLHAMLDAAQKAGIGSKPAEGDR